MSKVTDEMVDVAFDAGVVGGNSPAKMLRDGLQALFDQGLISLPADEAAIRESVVREAVEWLQDQGLRSHAKRLEASLLPTKDRAEELADEYFRGRVYNIEMHTDTVEAFRWLIEREG